MTIFSEVQIRFMSDIVDFGAVEHLLSIVYSHISMLFTDLYASMYRP